MIVSVKLDSLMASNPAAKANERIVVPIKTSRDQHGIILLVFDRANHDQCVSMEYFVDKFRLVINDVQ